MVLSLNSVIGSVCVLIGLIANIAGIGGGIVAIVNDSQVRSQSLQVSGNFILKFIQALTFFLRALTAAPAWIAVNFIGLIFLGVGIYLLNLDSGFVL